MSHDGLLLLHHRFEDGLSFIFLFLGLNKLINLGIQLLQIFILELSDPLLMLLFHLLHLSLELGVLLLYLLEVGLLVG